MFDTDKIIHAPSDPADWRAWRDSLERWRVEARVRMAYDDRLYRQPEFTWASRCFSVCFAMLGDETLYDHRAGRYRPDAFLDHGEREFGGFDAVVLWHAYPNIGFDDRNQFDYYRDAPGGLEGLRDLSRAFQARGVRVFMNYNPWDTGTRREAVSDAESVAVMVGALEADGVFLDTMRHGSSEFRARLDQVRPGVVFESESSLPLEFVHDHHTSWAQWFADSPAPGVLRNKWFERRHMMHQTRRWHRDHTEELQTAWMNGAGMLVWEDVFGSWVGWNARDRWLLRTMLPVQRRYADVFTDGCWTPLVETVSDGVYASCWTLEGQRLWTLVNRSFDAAHGAMLEVTHRHGDRYFDLMRGLEIERPAHGNTIELHGEIVGHGLGAFVALEAGAVNADFLRFLEHQRRAWHDQSLKTDFPERPIHLVPVKPTVMRSRSAVSATILLERLNTVQHVVFRNRECGLYGAAPFVNTWKPKFPDLHQPVTLERRVQITPCAVDAREVTNREYQVFLEATHYQPRHPERFLAHWMDGLPRPGEEDHAVVYVDLDDARAYARWAGKRLPTEEEWQCALNQLSSGNAVRHDGSRVWNWTESERSDGRTRFCILKGGADFKAQGSEWYADGGPRVPQFAAKFLLTWSGLSRSATIGFRCAVDLEESR